MTKKSVEQNMIEAACIYIGNALGALALGDDQKMEALDQVFSAQSAQAPGTPYDEISFAQNLVSERLRFGFDKMMAAHYNAKKRP